jgi:DNA end-binding protein Ku
VFRSNGTATSEREKISFHQLNKDTGNRIRYRKVDAETGDEVEQSNIIKGYELAKGEYVDVTPEELEAVAIESKRTIEIEEFVPKTQIDELYIRDPYYIAPDGEVGQQAFAVIREAIRKEGMVAVGQVVFTSREHIIVLEARDKGMLGITLRYPYEVRKQSDYFDEIKDERVPKDMLDLALHIVGTKRGEFKPGKFEDQYEDALRELIEKKAKGEKIERPKQPARSNVVNLMDALRASVQAEGRGESSKGRRAYISASKKSPRSHGKHKKASLRAGSESSFFSCAAIEYLKRSMNEQRESGNSHQDSRYQEPIAAERDPANNSAGSEPQDNRRPRVIG